MARVESGYPTHSLTLRGRWKSYQLQENVEDKPEARDGMIVGLRRQLAELATMKYSSELEKRLADQTHSVAMLPKAIQGDGGIQTAEVPET